MQVGLFALTHHVRGRVSKLRFAYFPREPKSWFIFSLRLMITDQDQAHPSDPKEDFDKSILPSRRRSRSRTLDDEGLFVANSPRRSERPDAMALTERQAIMIDGLQTQSQRLLTLGNSVRQDTGRQSRLEQTAPNIVGSIQTVLTKIDATQRKQGHALMQHEQKIANHPQTQDQLKSLPGQTATQQEMTHGRQLSSEEEFARTQQLSQHALRKQQSTHQVVMTRQLAHGQETFSLRKYILNLSLVKDEPTPPLEPPPMTSTGRNAHGQKPEIGPKLPSFTNATTPYGAPGLKFPDPIRDRPVSDSFKSTAP